MTVRNISSGLQPLASVVMVDYNGGTALKNAVDSILAQTIFDRLEFILVDNGSTDGRARQIAQLHHDTIKYVRSEVNLGFAGGNNLGFHCVLGGYILLLNNDAEADPDWAERLIEAAAENPDVGMVTSRILYHDNPLILDNAGHDIYPDGLNRSRGNDCPDGADYGRRCETLFASGCAALYLRDAVLKADGFDEDFFAYGDDAELGLKLRLMGYRCIYEPQARVLHHSSMTAGRFSLKKIFWIERNRIWILLKFFPTTWILRSPYYTCYRLLAAWKASSQTAGVAQEVRKAHSSLSLAKTILWAWACALVKLPVMLRRRYKLRKLKAVSDREWRNMLQRFSLDHNAMSFSRTID